MDLAFAEPLQGEFAGCGGRDHLHAADLLHHAGQQAGGRIAAREDQALLAGRLVIREHGEIGAGAGSSRALDYAIGLGQVVGRGAHRNADASRTDLANADGLTGARRGGAEQVGSEALAAIGRFAGEREQFFYGHLQFACEVERHLGVGDVSTGFDGVDGLAAHAHAQRQVGRAHAPALSNFR